MCLTKGKICSHPEFCPDCSGVSRLAELALRVSVGCQPCDLVRFGEATSLHDLIISHKIECVYAHTKFNAGQPPVQLAAKPGAKGYIPADGDAQSFVKVMKIAATCKKLALMWSVKVQDCRLPQRCECGLLSRSERSCLTQSCLSASSR